MNPDPKKKKVYYIAYLECGCKIESGTYFFLDKEALFCFKHHGWKKVQKPIETVKGE